MNVFCSTQNLYLRNIEVSDTQLIVKWKQDLLIRKMSIGLDVNITYENQEIDIKRSIGNKRELYWIIVLNNSQKPIGYVRINLLDSNERFAWLRFGLGEERGKGYAKEALEEAILKLFEIGIHRIDAEVYEFNERSLKLLKSLGFKHEGTRRQAYYEEGMFYDVIALGLVKDDLWSSI